MIYNRFFSFNRLISRFSNGRPNPADLRRRSEAQVVRATGFHRGSAYLEPETQPARPSALPDTGGGVVVLEGAVEDLVSRKSFNRLVNSLYRMELDVYSKWPFESSEFVFDYLGRYIHRVAISNDRILDVRDGNVSFMYKRRDEDYRIEIETIPAETFIARFLLNELPGGFFRIRHFGFLCNRLKKEYLERIVSFLGVEKLDEPPTLSTMELIIELLGTDVALCHVCKKDRLIKKFEFDRSGILKTLPKQGEAMNSA